MAKSQYQLVRKVFSTLDLGETGKQFLLYCENGSTRGVWGKLVDLV